MNKQFVELFVNSKEYQSLPKNYKIRNVDGSKSEIPNTLKSCEWAKIKDDSLKYIKPARVLFSTIIDANIWNYIGFYI